MPLPSSLSTRVGMVRPDPSSIQDSCTPIIKNKPAPPIETRFVAFVVVVFVGTQEAQQELMIDAFCS